MNWFLNLLKIAALTNACLTAFVVVRAWNVTGYTAVVIGTILAITIVFIGWYIAKK